MNYKNIIKENNFIINYKNNNNNNRNLEFIDSIFKHIDLQIKEKNDNEIIESINIIYEFLKKGELNINLLIQNEIIIKLINYINPLNEILSLSILYLINYFLSHENIIDFFFSNNFNKFLIIFLNSNSLEIQKSIREIISILIKYNFELFFKYYNYFIPFQDFFIDSTSIFILNSINFFYNLIDLNFLINEMFKILNQNLTSECTFCNILKSFSILLNLNDKIIIKLCIEQNWHSYFSNLIFSQFSNIISLGFELLTFLLKILNEDFIKSKQFISIQKINSHLNTSIPLCKKSALKFLNIYCLINPKSIFENFEYSIINSLFLILDNCNYSLQKLTITIIYNLILEHSNIILNFIDSQILLNYLIKFLEISNYFDLINILKSINILLNFQIKNNININLNINLFNDLFDNNNIEINILLDQIFNLLEN